MPIRPISSAPTPSPPPPPKKMRHTHAAYPIKRGGEREGGRERARARERGGAYISIRSCMSTSILACEGRNI
jgi:hypothetical protein